MCEGKGYIELPRVCVGPSIMIISAVMMTLFKAISFIFNKMRIKQTSKGSPAGHLEG